MGRAGGQPRFAGARRPVRPAAPSAIGNTGCSGRADLRGRVWGTCCAARCASLSASVLSAR
eukprot:6594083-Alexandrium_andersonii.AAC.1